MDLFKGCILSVVLIIVYWMLWRWRNKRVLMLAAQLPGPTALPILGNALMFMTKPEEQLKKIAALLEQYGDYIRFWLGPDLVIVIKDPTDIRCLLTSNKINQKGPAYDYMTPFIGKGILTGGPKWRVYRKIANPSYNKKSIETFSEVFNEEAEALRNVLRRRDNNIFNVYYDVLQCTTRAVCRTLMGLSKEEIVELKHLDEVIHETQNIYSLVFTKMTRWWLQIPLIYWLSGNYRKQLYYQRIVDGLITDIIEKRRKSLGKEENYGMGVVDRFILNGLSENEIKLESFALFTTSQEASAKIASGVLLFLAHLPEWQSKVYEEIVQVIDDDSVSDDQIRRLENLDMVYKEVLRYLSIAALIQRTVEEDVTISNGKFTLPSGTVVAIPIHEVHRDSRFWDEPLKIKPERFLPENQKNRDPNAFIPFSLGAMDCLGRVYATTLIKTIVIRVLRHVELSAEGKLEDLDLHVAISVKFAKGYNLRVRPRMNK
ncbi:cytochrome P450 4C1-like [Pieris napi]|uniref:cytochrome P450 4C1-like n=1 Tax=Pieris napi TaxID=78633 RepID=UPI001FBBA1D6|nr:cytochrome P450 4C1-like [Pieris napi]XP_047522731.1 cytochrome P450 4C1-like [Pieris napi]